MEIFHTHKVILWHQYIYIYIYIYKQTKWVEKAFDGILMGFNNCYIGLDLIIIIHLQVKTTIS